SGGSDDVFLRDAEQAVRVELRRTTAAYRTARAALPQVAGVQPERPGHATVYVMAAADESVLLSSGPDGARSVRCPGFDEGMLRRYVHESGLTAGRFDTLDECLAVLGRHVAGPLAGLLHTAGATRVTLIPVGLFCALPLHAAPYRDGRCLIDDFAVGYAPSRTVRDAVQRIADQRTGRARHGVAVVDPGSGLPAAGYEARMMLEHTGVGPPVTGSTAEVLDALTDATHIHFACHGVSLVDRPLQSHLVLGGGARLALVDLLAADPARRPHRARLVVASACQTATVETARNPDEYVGLPAGFLTAGVPCFVGTLWPAGDLPSALLTTRFYELLFDAGRPADEALGGAQRWLRDLTGADLVAYLDDHPALAEVAEGVRRFAVRFPQRRFYARPEVWSPHVLIGVPIQEGPAQ
ncbi:CHAT domain-containing protein, partial [Actinoplanes sp. NPDC026670]|uniref:CHAT domain-containing protein n=1 Tax=Actinoplanes sp. NPDC026670 TaxID=3154700 RepID=UPI0033EF44FC